MTNKWTCPTCGLKVDITDQEEHGRIVHLMEHNPTPGQWSEAYAMIQQGKERAKARDKASA